MTLLFELEVSFRITDRRYSKTTKITSVTLLPSSAILRDSNYKHLMLFGTTHSIDFIMKNFWGKIGFLETQNLKTKRKSENQNLEKPCEKNYKTFFVMKVWPTHLCLKTPIMDICHQAFFKLLSVIKPFFFQFSVLKNGHIKVSHSNLVIGPILLRKTRKKNVRYGWNVFIYCFFFFL